MKEEIIREDRKYLKLDENQNKNYQNLWDTALVGLMVQINSQRSEQVHLEN